ncbi:hypothetical protein, partial [Streptomyces ziwulingensis]|uniref:hypothetical protein n=1 Tax=Streptomyces ziwulingensis TaxID=1045501 RepID=UPI0031ECBCA5
MPQENLRVDTDGLLRAAGALGPVAERLRLLAEGVQHQLEALNDPAGNDKFGQQFKGKHDPQSALVRSGVLGVGTAVTNAGQGLESLSDVFEAAEDGARSTATRLNDQLNEGGGKGGGGR